MIYYESSVYFFVNKNNKKLADRIGRGLKISMNDGSFDRLFFSVPNFKRGYEEQTSDKRIILKLNSQF
ncbi:MAG: hypothetical protein EOP48_29215 [Sphingobacteriales bacterium]|nr:MAG: hypothetical protein EOP48_29215 [Sphingobacteriales bacterium]